MALGLFVLLILLAALVGFAFWLWALIDALQRPEAEWQRAGQSKLVWILVMIFLGLLGSFIYLVVARPRLNEVRDQLW